MRRAEYWVSQKRKFCDYCKCSIADNKPSVQFHENGKKHKENVQKRLAEMQKKAAKDAKEQSSIDKQMKKMEKAALAAYLKDIESNPDFTSQVIKETIETANKTVEEEKAATPISKATSAAPKKKEKKWMEAKTGEDYTYYWHSETLETVWEVPKEGFVSLEEQEKEAQVPKEKLKAKTKIKKEKNVSELNKEIYGKSMKKEVVGELIGPSPRPSAYSGWTAVVKQEDQALDLDLPEPPAPAPLHYVPVAVAAPEPATKQFKERKAPTTSTADVSGIAFKKRKLGGARNARQRTADE